MLPITVLTLFVLGLTAAQSNVQRGAQIRLSSKGLEYAAGVGMKRLLKDLQGKRLKDKSDKKGKFQWKASGITIEYVRIPQYKLQPVAGVGLRASVGGIQLQARGKLWYRYKKGWIKFQDTTNVVIKAKGLGFSVGLKVDAKNGLPTATAYSCAATLSDIDLDFSGGLDIIYNLVSGIFEQKLKSEFKELLCKEGNDLINKNVDKMLKTLTVKKAIDKWAVVNYEFEKPYATNNYFDLLLKGEFQNRYDPKPSFLPPPSFDVTSAADKMVYIWLSEYTLNSAGLVYHEAGFLNKVIKPTDKLIKGGIAPFINTRSFQRMIPGLYAAHPNRPLQFTITTYRAPAFKVQPGKITCIIFAKVQVQVQAADGKVVPAFHIYLDVSAVGSVFVHSNYTIGGKIKDFKFGTRIGGSTVGVVNLPLDNPAVKAMVRGLVIDQANPMIQKGFPLPKVKDLELVNPKVTFVHKAIRIDTDVKYNTAGTF